jgi:hypothetical protein
VKAVEAVARHLAQLQQRALHPGAALAASRRKGLQQQGDKLGQQPP